MEKNIANELKKVDIEIGKKLFSISKKNKIEAVPSPLQARIIDFLIINQEKEDICQKDLEEHFNVSKATISGALQIMENNGIIKRVIAKEDARSKKIILTEKSKKAHKEMYIIFKNLDEELKKGISKEELEIFYNIIEKLKNNLRN